MGRGATSAAVIARRTAHGAPARRDRGWIVRTRMRLPLPVSVGQDGEAGRQQPFDGPFEPYQMLTAVLRGRDTRPLQRIDQVYLGTSPGSDLIVL